MSEIQEEDIYSLDYDLEKQIAVIDDNIKPSEISVFESKVFWIYANNNKYRDSQVDHSKVGKWMLFASNDDIDELWDKVKCGIRDGNLWHSKVSTRNERPNQAIMIYTKDYTDIEDVIRVLDYLQTNGLTANLPVIKYKTDEQTLNGIYSGGAERPWIYSSKTIRNRKTQQSRPTRRSDQLNWRSNE